MKNRILLMVLALLVSLPAGAEEGAKKVDDLRRILVTEIVNNDVKAPWVPLLADHVAQNLSKGENIKALTMSDLAEVAKFASSQADLNCTEKLACVSEMSKYADAPEVIQGRIGKIGNDYLLTLVLVDAAKANPLSRVSKNFTDAQPIEEVVNEAVNELMNWEAKEAAMFSLKEGEAVSLAVFDLNTAGVSDTIASNLTQILTAVVKEAPGTSVINRDDITAMLQLESDKQMLGCTDDMSCLSEIGGALGVDKIIVGQVGRVEREYVVSLRIIDPTSAKVENRVLETFKGEETSLLHAMKQAGRRLMGLNADQPGIMLVSTTQPNAQLFLDGEPKGILPLPPIKDLPPGRHSIRVVKKRFFDYEADVYVEPGDMSSQYVELKKIPVKFIELPPAVWWGVVSLGGVAGVLTGGFYYLQSFSNQQINEIIDAAPKDAGGNPIIDGGLTTPLQDEAADAGNNGMMAAISTAAILGFAGVLAPFVVWEE